MQQPLNVTALTKYIKTIVENDQYLSNVYLEGEISNFVEHSSGVWYFRIKDEGAQISALMFRNFAQSVSFLPRNGDKILVTGRITLYERRGDYSISVFSMKKSGIGELYQKQEELKKLLEQQGYFKDELKQAIPSFPKKIGVVTSPTGAVIQDIKTTVARRYPLAQIYLFPALVQGEGAAMSIAKQIERANEMNDIDVLIVGRGGGSIEDLWAFNEMPVISAIMQSRIPIITAIGHETDNTISDYVSDRRAPTPTAAAELATPDIVVLHDQINRLERSLTSSVRRVFEKLELKLVNIVKYLDSLSPSSRLQLLEMNFIQAKKSLKKNYQDLILYKKQKTDLQAKSLKSPKYLISEYQRQLMYLTIKNKKSYQEVLKDKRYLFEKTIDKVALLNPLSLMEKGYSIASFNGKSIRSVNQIEIDDDLIIQVVDGEIRAQVKGKKKNER